MFGIEKLINLLNFLIPKSLLKATFKTRMYGLNLNSEIAKSERECFVGFALSL